MALRRFWWLVDRVVGRDRADDDLGEEIRAHLEINAQQRMEEGESRSEAWAGARRDLGNELLVREATREVWAFTSLERLWQDARYAIRGFRRSAGLTLVVSLVLALGIGATTAIFTIVYSVLLRPLSFPDPDRLVMAWERTPNTGRNNPVSMANFQTWKERNRSFESIAAYHGNLLNLLGADEPVQVTGAQVTADFFRVLGVNASLGRTFVAGEDAPNVAPTVVLSHGFWVRRFGGRADVIGERISINATHHEIIGVLPASFAYPHRVVEAFVPLRGRREGGRNLSVVGRLRPRVSVTDAREDMRALAVQTSEERPVMNANWSATVVPLHEQMVGQIRRPLLVLFAAVALVLLIACANIANLLLMRSAARAREFAIRLALGAGRWRLLHQVMVESVALASVGAAFGVALAWILVRGFVRLAASTFEVPRLGEVSIDPWVLAFAVTLAAGTAVVFGLGPALASAKVSTSSGAAPASRSVTSGHRRLQASMVIAEVALALPLLVAAGLMGHSFMRLRHVDPGFRAEGVLTARMLLLPAREARFHAEFVSDALERIRALPQVLAAGSIGRLPLDGGNSGSWYYRADRPDPPRDQRPSGDISIITPGYFAAMGIPLVKGRDFDDGDRLGGVPVGILNQTAARAIYRDEDPIGKRLTVSWNDAREVEIIGIARDIRHGRLDLEPDPCLFLPNGQQPFPFSSLVIRTAGDPLSVVDDVKHAIRSTDPDQGVGDIHTMEQLVGKAIAQPRAQSVLFAAFGAVALVLTCVGIYGVLAYAVTLRTREIGVRLALGASPGSAFAFVLRDGMRLTLAGLVIGLTATLVLTRFMQGLLYEVEPLDPVVLTTVTMLLALVAVTACSIPAVRATRVDPAIVLREE